MHLEAFLLRLSRRRRRSDRQIGDNDVAHARERRFAGAGGVGDVAAVAGTQALDNGSGGAIEQVKPGEHRQCVGKARWVGREGAGGDDVERIAEHVGDGQHEDGGGDGGHRQVAAMHQREVLADGV